MLLRKCCESCTVALCLLTLQLTCSGIVRAAAPGPRPATPTNVQAQWAGTDAHGMPRGVILTWSPVAGATSYTVYRGTIIAPRPAGVAAVLRRGVTATTFFDPEIGMGVDTITFYQVTAVNAAGESGKSATASPGLVSATVPVVVQGTLVQVSGLHLWLKTPDQAPVCPPGMLCPQYIILGTTYQVDASAAVFEMADGTPTVAPPLLAGQSLIVVGHKELSRADAQTPVIVAQALELVATSPPTTSGIDGVALVGPIAPVERPGEPNARPLPNAVITVQPDGGGAEIVRQRTDPQGHFRIVLPPGRYRVVPLPPQPNQTLPRGEIQTVTVTANQFANITVHYDSGIR
jgi:hypothetical protein